MESKHRTSDKETPAKAGTLHITITDETGAPVDVPDEVYRLTHEVLSIVAEGGTAAVVEVEHDLTTPTAAEILGVSRRPHLIKLLDQGEIPYYKVGSHRRLAVADVLAYKRRRDAQHEALAELTTLSQELGLY